jgi:hypothetical protein
MLRPNSERKLLRKPLDTPELTVQGKPVNNLNGTSDQIHPTQESKNESPKEVQFKPRPNKLKETETFQAMNSALNEFPADIEEISLQPLHLLHQAIQERNPSYYQQALTYTAEQRALQKRVDQLRHRAQMELEIKARRLTSKYYGWTELPWKAPISCQSQDLDDIWRMLRSTTAHEYSLEDPNVSLDFFNQMRRWVVGQDVSQFQAQWGDLYGAELNSLFSPYPEVCLLLMTLGIVSDLEKE